MPIHRGPRLDDMISRLSYRAMPIQANIYKTWPNLAVSIGVTPGQAVPGSWVEFISATNAPSTPFTVMVCQFDVLTMSTRFEVGIGGAGAEVSVANTFLFGAGAAYGVPQPIPIIPGGTRVAIRGTAANNIGVLGARSVKVISILLPARLDPFSTLQLTEKLSSWRPALSDLGIPSLGLASSAAATWTYGNYAEMYAASVETMPVILTACSFRSDAAVGLEGQVALATGAAGLEVDFFVFPHEPLRSPNICYHMEFPIPLIMPGSTRLSARYATSSASAQGSYGPNLTVVKAAYMP